MQQLRQFIIAAENPPTVLHAARNAVAAVVSYLIAELFHLREAYWAPIATLIVMQSTIAASLPISLERFAGTAIGAAIGAVMVFLFGGSFWAFALAVFLAGLLCAVFQVERSAYRYASITLAIVMLIPRSTSVWFIAVHRFFEVSLGIAIGLMLSAVWLERQRQNLAHEATLGKP